MFGLAVLLDMTRSGFPRIGSRQWVAWVVLALFLPTVALSAGLSFIPDATVQDIHPRDRGINQDRKPGVARA